MAEGQGYSLLEVYSLLQDTDIQASWQVLSYLASRDDSHVASTKLIASIHYYCTMCTCLLTSVCNYLFGHYYVHVYT